MKYADFVQEIVGPMACDCCGRRARWSLYLIDTEGEEPNSDWPYAFFCMDCYRKQINEPRYGIEGDDDRYWRRAFSSKERMLARRNKSGEDAADCGPPKVAK